MFTHFSYHLSCYSILNRAGSEFTRLKYKWTRKWKRKRVFRWNPPKTTTCHITTFFFLLFASETLVVDQKHTNTLGCKVGTVLAICILIFKSPTLKGMVVFLKNISYQMTKNSMIVQNESLRIINTRHQWPSAFSSKLCLAKTGDMCSHRNTSSTGIVVRHCEKNSFNA